MQGAHEPVTQLEASRGVGKLSSDIIQGRDRGRTLGAKLDVISETARALTDIIDADRSVRLEWTVIVLIAMEIFLTLFQMWMARGR